MLKEIEDHFVTTKHQLPLSTLVHWDEWRKSEILKRRKEAAISLKVGRLKWKQGKLSEGLSLIGRAGQAALQSRVGNDPELESILNELNSLATEEEDLLEASKKLEKLSLSVN